MSTSSLEAVIELNNDQMLKSLGEITTAMSNFTDESNKKLDDVINNFTKLDTQASKNADKQEGNAQRQKISFGKIEKSMLAVSAISAGLFSQMVSNSPGLSAAMAEIDFLFEEMFMTLGESLAPLFEDVFVPIIKDLTEAFLNLDPELQTFIAGAIGITAVVAPLIGILSTLGVGFSILTSPILLVVGAIALFAVAYKTNFMGIKDFTDKIIGKIVKAFTKWKENNSGTFERIGKKLKELWELMKPILTKIFDIFKDVFEVYIDYVIKKVMNNIDFLIAVFEGLIDFFIAVFKGDWEGAFDALMGIVDAWFTKIKKNFEAFIDFVGDIMDTITEHLDIGDKTDIVIEFVTNGVEGALNFLVDGYNGFLDILNAPLKAIKDSSFLSRSIRDSIPDLSNYKLAQVNLGGGGGEPEGGTFHRGGVVPGRMGEERIVKVLAGEVISNPMRGQTPMSVMGASTSTSPPVNITIHNTFTNPQFTNEVGMRQTIGQIDNTLRKNVHQYIGGR